MSLAKRKELLPGRNVCSEYPAINCDDALMTGNGSHRAEILGDPCSEQIFFSHELLYEPIWKNTPDPPDLTAIMPDLRKSLLAGNFQEAAALTDAEQRRQGAELIIVPGGDTYPARSLRVHRAFGMALNQQFAHSPVSYLRYLDLLNGECVVRWDTPQGAWRRGVFASFSKQAVFQRVTAPGRGLLNLDLTFLMPGEIPGKLEHPELCDIRLTIAGDMAVLSCAYCPEYGNKGYIAGIRIIRTGGTARAEGNRLRIENADALLLITRIVKYESDFNFGLAESLQRELYAISGDYEAMLAENRSALGGRMERSGISLSEGDAWAMSAEELIREQHSCKEFSAGLLEKLYDMGRFFQIVYTGSMPPSFGQHNINTNLQVCGGNITGLDKEMEVYFRFYEDKVEDFRTNARRLFGVRGLLASVHCDYNSGLCYHFSKTFPHYCWTGCLGWIYNEFWGHYLVTGDKNFLRDRIIPVLKEIALFFEEYASHTDTNGQSIFYPSFSPENPTPENGAPEGLCATSINAVMDIMICREVLDNLIDGCTELGIEQENIGRWKKQRAKLPKYLLDDEGGLKEWAWPTVGENYNHRHVSHHYDAWPGHVITWEDTPDLARAVLISNRKRAQQNDSAHGIIHRLFTAIRLKDLSDTIQNLKQLMEHGFLTRALNTFHNPYVTYFPDLLGAMPALLVEMAVYSAPGVVEFLPSMPGSLGKGVIKGIWLYTFAKLESMSWDVAKGFIRAELIPLRNQTLTLRCRRSMRTLRVDGREALLTGDHTRIEVKEAVPVTIDIELA
jgi:hypothetical protein